jgi:hypothetical protein
MLVNQTVEFLTIRPQPPGKESIYINSGRRVTASSSPPTVSKPMEIQTLHTNILFIGKMLSADPLALLNPRKTPS